VATADQQLKDPSLITPPVELENGKLQCTSCHDPHDNTNGKFLVTTRQNSDLCLSCHDRDYWSGSTHNSSTATWNGSGSDPWFHTDYTNVGDNACENSHNPHNASDPSQPLLNSNIEETNCLVCHSGNVASTDIQTEISKIYSHNVSSYNLIHDVGEAALISTKHVECYDCHNPHATNNSTASAPNVNGFNQGVKGVDLSGNNIEPIQYQYELCFRCHGDSPDKPGAPTLRLFPETNVRLEFNPSNASYHPVVAAGANSNVPSLISPLTESSIIYCTDCHASDDDTAPSGPHGSTNEHILKARYSTQDNRREQSNLYALCYSCHSRNSILGDNSFKEHDKHLDSADAPCNACHDPHGSSGNTHLINFDLNIVSPRNGVLLFEDLGQFKGRCTLRCHGENHNGRSY
jgi:predicted CXXCH cytochrome family protein